MTDSSSRSAADIVIALDTSNEVVALGVGRLDAQERSVELVAERNVAAHRASNTQLLPLLDDLLASEGIDRSRIACVACGRGPGSFTGVRICMATAKGIASALEVSLVGVSTLDAVAWGLWHSGVRGAVLVMADAMRKEVYPVAYGIAEEGPVRRNDDRVMKAQAAADQVAADSDPDLLLAGDALAKYAELFAGRPLVDKALWPVSGSGLLLAVQDQWRRDIIDPFDAIRHDPALLLPVYTRLSDAEENERLRLAAADPKDLRSGVQWHGRDAGIVYRPLDAAHVEAVAQMEQAVMGADAWNAALVADELPRTDRTWWAAYEIDQEGALQLAGYAGGWIVDGQVQILKVGVDPSFRRRGIARELLARMSEDARSLGAREATLEVRAGNAGAIAFYQNLGLRDQGARPHYYQDGEDARIMTGPLPAATGDVAGMRLQVQAENPTEAEAGSTDERTNGPSAAHRPLILAIESSCDETAAAIIDGTGTLQSSVVASQIDFHSRFGGVVPEIASRKHVEAICGVTQVCREQAAAAIGADGIRWRDLDAVAVTYAPGLVGALVVGVAFAKGAAWGADIPFIRVNHMEGHLYANKIARPDIEPPLVVSLVSGGHTMLVHVRAWGDYRVLGSTLDDAVGEAFDKVAKALGLGYPGGPVISKLAAQGNPAAIEFPRAMMHSGDLRFSLSGLKTAVITYIDRERRAGRELDLPDIAASFQAAVIDVQVAKAATALQQTGAKEFCLGGGVAANPALREAYENMCASRGVRVTLPPLSACTDNASMIALVALERFERGLFSGLDSDAQAHADLEQPY